VVSIVGATLMDASAPGQTIDTARSVLTVNVFKAGLFRAFADNHVIRAPIAEGALDDDPARPGIHFTINTGDMRVLDPGLKPGDRQQVQERMLGPEVLDAARFPKIEFTSSEVRPAGSDAWTVRGTLTLHGQSRTVAVNVRRKDSHYVGSVPLRQTDYGIAPISIVGGTVKVKDELRIDFDIVAASIR
jgi:hypothetical protein